MTTNSAIPTSELDGTAKPGEAPPPGLVNRYSPGAQVGILAAAIVPTIVWYVGFSLTPTPDDPYLFVAEIAVFCLLYGMYFVGLIWLVNIYPRRRKWAVTAAILAVVADTVVSSYLTLPDVHVAAILVDSTDAAITVAYVAAWGIARRQSKSWMFGMPFAAIVAEAAQRGLFRHPGGSYWWEPWTCWVGSFIIGCLFCWAFDLLGRRVKMRGEAASS